MENDFDAQMETARRSSAATPADVGALFTTNSPGFNQQWLESKMIPQTRVFYNDMLPVLFAMCGAFWRGKPLSIADIGTNSGAGIAHLSDVLNGITGFRAKFTGFDTDPRYEAYARAKFPQIEFVGGDFFDDARTFDIALCSHTLEHIPEPAAWVGRVLERVNTAAIFYVPYEEQELIAGHVNRFTDDLLRTMPSIVWARVSKSAGWKSGENPRCVAFVCLPEATRKYRDDIRVRLDAETMSGPISL